MKKINMYNIWIFGTRAKIFLFLEKLWKSSFSSVLIGIWLISSSFQQLFTTKSLSKTSSTQHLHFLAEKKNNRNMGLDSFKFNCAIISKLFIGKMPQSGVGSMQGKNTRNMPSIVCASSMNKSLTPLQYKCKVLH